MRSAIYILIISFALVQCDAITGGGDDVPSYSFSASVSPEEGGSVDPSSGTFDEGEEVEVTASPETNWEFVEWTGDQQSTENPLTFEITEDTEVTANFQETAQGFEHTVTVTDSDNSIDLVFGMTPDATDDFDEGIDEELPPPPPSGSFYGQFTIPDYALSSDFRTVTSDTKSWELEFAPDEGNTITLNWDFSESNHIGSLTLVDDLDNPSLEVDMKSESSHSVSESTNTLYIVSN